MIEEDYVSFEVARLLKEKGFDEPVMYHFTPDGTQRKFQQAFYRDDVAQPTLQTAMKWLRKKGIIITIVYTRCSMQTIGSRMMFGFNIQNTQGELLSENTDVAYDSYEQAGTDAIKHSLENLV